MVLLQQQQIQQQQKTPFVMMRVVDEPPLDQLRTPPPLQPSTQQHQQHQQHAAGGHPRRSFSVLLSLWKQRDHHPSINGNGNGHGEASAINGNNNHAIKSNKNYTPLTEIDDDDYDDDYLNDQNLSGMDQNEQGQGQGQERAEEEQEEALFEERQHPHLIVKPRKNKSQGNMYMALPKDDSGSSSILSTNSSNNNGGYEENDDNDDNNQDGHEDDSAWDTSNQFLLFSTNKNGNLQEQAMVGSSSSFPPSPTQAEMVNLSDDSILLFLETANVTQQQEQLIKNKPNVKVLRPDKSDARRQQQSSSASSNLQLKTSIRDAVAAYILSSERVRIIPENAATSSAASPSTGSNNSSNNKHNTSAESLLDGWESPSMMGGTVVVQNHGPKKENRNATVNKSDDNDEDDDKENVVELAQPSQTNNIRMIRRGRRPQGSYDRLMEQQQREQESMGQQSTMTMIPHQQGGGLRRRPQGSYNRLLEDQSQQGDESSTINAMETTTEAPVASTTRPKTTMTIMVQPPPHVRGRPRVARRGGAVLQDVTVSANNSEKGSNTQQDVAFFQLSNKNHNNTINNKENSSQGQFLAAPTQQHSRVTLRKSQFNIGGVPPPPPLPPSIVVVENHEHDDKNQSISFMEDDHDGLLPLPISSNSDSPGDLKPEETPTAEENEEEEENYPPTNSETIGIKPTVLKMDNLKVASPGKSTSSDRNNNNTVANFSQRFLDPIISPEEEDEDEEEEIASPSLFLETRDTAPEMSSALRKLSRRSGGKSRMDNGLLREHIVAATFKDGEPAIVSPMASPHSKSTKVDLADANAMPLDMIRQKGDVVNEAAAVGAFKMMSSQDSLVDDNSRNLVNAEGVVPPSAIFNQHRGRNTPSPIKKNGDESSIGADPEDEDNGTFMNLFNRVTCNDSPLMHQTRKGQSSPLQQKTLFGATSTPKQTSRSAEHTAALQGLSPVVQTILSSIALGFSPTGQHVEMIVTNSSSQLDCSHEGPLDHSLLSGNNSPTSGSYEESATVVNLMASVFASSPIASPPQVAIVISEDSEDESETSQFSMDGDGEHSKESVERAPESPNQATAKETTAAESSPQTSPRSSGKDLDQSAENMKSPLLMVPRAMMKERSSSSGRSSFGSSQHAPLKLEACLEFDDDDQADGDASSGGTIMAQSQQAEDEDDKDKGVEVENEVCIFGVPASSAINNQAEFELNVVGADDIVSHLSSPCITASSLDASELGAMLGKSDLLSSEENLLPSTPESRGDDDDAGVNFGGSYPKSEGSEKKPGRRVTKVYLNTPSPGTNIAPSEKATTEQLSPLAKRVRENYSRQRKKPIFVSLVQRVFRGKKGAPDRDQGDTANNVRHNLKREPLQKLQLAAFPQGQPRQHHKQQPQQQQQNGTKSQSSSKRLESVDNALHRAPPTGTTNNDGGRGLETRRNSNPPMRTGELMSALNPEQEDEEITTTRRLRTSVASQSQTDENDGMSEEDEDRAASFLPLNLTTAHSTGSSSAVSRRNKANATNKGTKKSWNQFMRGAAAQQPQRATLPRKGRQLYPSSTTVAANGNDNVDDDNSNLSYVLAVHRQRSMENDLEIFEDDSV